MKALVIAPQPFFSPRGTPLSVYYRTLVTAELGVEIDLLTYGQGQDVDIPGVRIRRIPNFPFLGPVKTGPSMLKLFLDGFMMIWTFGLLLGNRYDFVHAHEEAVFFCRFLKPIFGFKLVYDMHSSLPQQLTNFSFTESRLLISFFEMLEDTSLRAADATITICPALADYARSRVRDDRRQLLIENSLFDPIRLAGGSAGGSSQAAGLPSDRPLVVYAGTFESYQGIEIVISAFARVVEQCPNAFLLMIGGTTRQVEAQRAFAHECGLDDHCLFTGTVDKSVAESYQRHADVLLSPRTEGMNTPLKIYEQLASGIPLVATRIPSHTQVLNDDVCILVGPDPESMANGILTALTDSERRASVVAGARALYEAKYSRSIYETKMRQLLELLA